MRTIRCTLMYDGARYVGWQVQPNGVSIQSLVQRAIRTMTGEENDLVGASRTDAGVHALGQVAHFQTASGISSKGFQAGINAQLPPDIVVTATMDASDGFHARNDARAKRYTYRLLIAPDRSPMLEHRCWHLQRMPDVDAMREASRCLVGEHDFASFRAAGCSSAHAVRTIERIEMEERMLSSEMLAGEGRIVDVHIEGTGFVRHMVRNIVGTLVEVGQGRRDVSDVQRILFMRTRAEAGRCAPACGLYLVSISYAGF